MRHWSPVAWLFIVNAVAVCVLLLAAVVQARSAPKPMQTCVTAEERAKIDVIVQRGIERGFEAQVQLLYQTWARDSPSQPTTGRSAKGLGNGVEGYLRASRHREDWEPPLCP